MVESSVSVGLSLGYRFVRKSPAAAAAVYFSCTDPPVSGIAWFRRLYDSTTGDHGWRGLENKRNTADSEIFFSFWEAGEGFFQLSGPVRRRPAFKQTEGEEESRKLLLPDLLILGFARWSSDQQLQGRHGKGPDGHGMNTYLQAAGS